MANVTPGFLVPSPLRSAAAPPSWTGRFVGNLLEVGGDKTASGRTYVAGAPVPRRVVIMTQPPQSQVVYESNTILPGAAFSFPKLASGKYVVLDIALDGSEQALVYDWVAPL